MASGVGRVGRQQPAPRSCPILRISSSPVVSCCAIVKRLEAPIGSAPKCAMGGEALVPPQCGAFLRKGVRELWWNSTPSPWLERLSCRLSKANVSQASCIGCARSLQEPTLLLQFAQPRLIMPYGQDPHIINETFINGLKPFQLRNPLPREICPKVRPEVNGRGRWHGLVAHGRGPSRARGNRPPQSPPGPWAHPGKSTQSQP